MLVETLSHTELRAAAYEDGPIPSGEQPSKSSLIRTLREEAGLSQCDLAMNAGLLPDHLRALEDGVEPTVSEWQALATALGIASDQPV